MPNSLITRDHSRERFVGADEGGKSCAEAVSTRSAEDGRRRINAFAERRGRSKNSKNDKDRGKPGHLDDLSAGRSHLLEVFMTDLKRFQSN